MTVDCVMNTMVCLIPNANPLLAEKESDIEGFGFCPVQSTDFDPIEHVWSILETMIENKRHLFHNSKDPKQTS
ncbi:hypothetical protein HPULCUR_002942 [Helicostylum pulchrum]|uniref:Transposase n=1 Tax=Helicostylum pulchrum TaxID=562976 RepID=A0ABP9XRY6_9FUNG